MWKVTSVGKRGGLGRNGWWGCDGRGLYNEKKEHWEKEVKKKKGEIKRSALKEKGEQYHISAQILPPWESLCKALCSFMFEHKSDYSL